jgi:hypothetical protein
MGLKDVPRESLRENHRDHREEIIKNSIKINKINNLLCVLCGLFLHNLY